MQQPRYAMKVAARLSGLTPFVIRSWERRYGVIRPERTDTNRRLYSDEDVEHLRLLRKLTDYGHAIGGIADLSMAELRELLDQEEQRRRSGDGGATKGDVAKSIREQLIRHARALDARAIEETLLRSSAELTQREMLEQVIIPTSDEIGRGWMEGSLRIAHEHVATAVMRNYLLNLLSGSRAAEGAPSAVAATPQGQMHELGALMIANIVAMNGWDVTYLGPDLPAEEIAASARDLQASVVLLSIVFPTNDPRIGPELSTLARLLPKDTRIIIGGRAAAGYDDTLARINAQRVESIDTLIHLLAENTVS
ncbi:MAG: MerR family transcriptional regulator [Bacteroidetes bacterium]|nr:MerR family transcriptional regulator [Bacteroidota bacterium]